MVLARQNRMTAGPGGSAGKPENLIRASVRNFWVAALAENRKRESAAELKRCG